MIEIKSFRTLRLTSPNGRGNTASVARSLWINN
jgi:hypothetical protein